MESQLSKRLEQISLEQPEHTIYRLYDHLRSVNHKAYDPQVVAIGPYHRGKKNLEMLEEHKLIYLKSLRKSKEELGVYVSAIQPLEHKARSCYAESISMSPTEFIDMLILDGCFIIHLVNKFSQQKSKDNKIHTALQLSVPNSEGTIDPLLQIKWITHSLQRDLMLFENQIPFFILLELCKLIRFPDETRLMKDLSSFFEELSPGKGYIYNYRKPEDIKHLLDFVHGSWDHSSHSPNKNNGSTANQFMRFIDSAKYLKEANVEFKEAHNDGLFEVHFQNGVMTLAPLRIVDRTESFLRNLIAYEHYFQHSETRFATDYGILMDSLIDSSKDIEILSSAKIIQHWMGDDEVVVNMFNRLTDGVIANLETFRYKTVFEDVHTHCNRRTNKYWASLRHNYLNGPWAILSFVVGLIILILAVTQTGCSLYQVLQ